MHAKKKAISKFSSPPSSFGESICNARYFCFVVVSTHQTLYYNFVLYNVSLPSLLLFIKVRDLRPFLILDYSPLCFYAFVKQGHCHCTSDPLAVWNCTEPWMPINMPIRP